MYNVNIKALATFDADLILYYSSGYKHSPKNNIAFISKRKLGAVTSVYRLSRKEGNVLFNDALNTFYLLLYGVRHMVKDHSDSERGNLLLSHRLLFPINIKGSFILNMHHPTHRILHTTAFVTPVVEHWLE